MTRPPSRREVLKGLVALGAAGALKVQAAHQVPAARPPGVRNILSISLDDLNDWVGFLGGHPQTLTPHMDRLAARGMRFTHAYTPFPLCHPARVSVFTGLEPRKTAVLDNLDHLSQALPDALTLERFMRAHGYGTYGIGKTYHFAGDSDFDFDTGHYSRAPEATRRPHNGLYDPRQEKAPASVRGLDWCASSAPREKFPDVRRLRDAQRFLRSRPRQPFFAAVGFSMPHAPWYVPGEYLERFGLNSIVLPNGDRTGLPAGAPGVDEVHPRILATGTWKAAVRAYLACIAFVDDLVGELLDTLDEVGLSEHTSILLWSDNGLHLGEKQRWHKETLWERTTHVPLAIVAPGVAKPGSTCDEPVSLVDLYPTVVDLSGLAMPPGLDGKSLLPQLRDPATPVSRPARTVMGSGSGAVRSRRWRYICYANGDEELYDHDADPSELRNLAQDPALRATKAELARWLPGPARELAAVEELRRYVYREGRLWKRRIRQQVREFILEHWRPRVARTPDAGGR